MRRWGRGAFKARVRPRRASAGAGRRGRASAGLPRGFTAVPSARNPGLARRLRGRRTHQPRARARRTWPRSRNLAAVAAAQPGRKARRSNGGGGDPGGVIGRLRGAGSGRRGIGRAPGRGAAGRDGRGLQACSSCCSRSPARSGVSCHPPVQPPGSPGGGAAPGAGGASYSPGEALPGFPGPHQAPLPRAPLHPAGSRAPRSRLR